MQPRFTFTKGEALVGAGDVAGAKEAFQNAAFWQLQGLSRTLLVDAVGNFITHSKGPHSSG